MNFDQFCIQLEGEFMRDAQEVKSGEWQSQDVSDRPEMVAWELEDYTLQWHIPSAKSTLQDAVRPNLPWAEEHFQERVGGQPLNPPPSHERWPHRQKNNEGHMPDGRFSHTYPERFWPKEAGRQQTWKSPAWPTPSGGPRDVEVIDGEMWEVLGGERVHLITSEDFEAWGYTHPHNEGIRFKYGDLGDVVAQLRRSPGTRQAYLPVWFPEDTGAVHGERVPCTLGYLFKIRADRLNCTYYIRSCDFMRHFRDDVYMAARLVQWMCQQLSPDRGADVGYPKPGRLTMHVGSFHIFAGDKPILEHRKQHRIARAMG